MIKLEKTAVNHLVEKYGVKKGEIKVVKYERDLLLNTVFQTDEYMYNHEFFYEGNESVTCKELQKTRINEGRDKADQSAMGQNPPAERGFSSMFEEAHSSPTKRGESSFNPLKDNLENPPTKRGENPPTKRVEDLELEIVEVKKEIKRLSKFEEKMKSKRKITQEQVDMIKELLLEGKKTQSEIVELSGTSNGTLWRVKKGYYD